MPITIKSKNGINNDITVSDKKIDTQSTSLSFPGNKYLNWGLSFNENFYWLLESFAGGTPPSPPVVGQLWFDSTQNRLKLYNGTNWVLVDGGINITNTLPSSGNDGDISLVVLPEERSLYYFENNQWNPVIRIRNSQVPFSSPVDGDIWFDSVNNDLFIYFNGNFIQINNQNSTTTTVNVSNHTTTMGAEIYVIKMANNIVAAFSYTTILPGDLGILDGTDLSTIFTVGLKPGLTFSSIGKNIIFNSTSEITLENVSSGNIKFRIDGSDRLTISKTNNNVTVNSPTTINGSLDVNNTSHIKIPAGSNTQRPTTPSVGMMRFNTTTTKIEYYDGTLWREVTSDFEVKSSEQFPLSANPQIPFNSVVSVPHGGTTIPKMYNAYAKCVVSAGGYNPGDEILLAHQTDFDEGSGPSRDFFSTWADNTNIGFAAMNQVRITEKNGGNYINISNSPNFVLIFKWIP